MSGPETLPNTPKQEAKSHSTEISPKNINQVQQMNQNFIQMIQARAMSDIDTAKYSNEKDMIKKIISILRSSAANESKPETELLSHDPLSNTQEKTAALHMRIRNFEIQNREYEATIEQQKNKIQRLHKEYGLQLELKDAQIENLQRFSAKLSDEEEEPNVEELHGRYKMCVEKLEATISGLMQEINAINTTFKQLQGNYKALESNCNEAIDKLITKGNTVQQQAELIAQLNVKSGKLEYENNMKGQSLEIINADLEQLQREHRTLKQKEQKQRAAIGRLSTDLTSLYSLGQGKNEVIEDMQQYIGNMNDRYETIVDLTTRLSKSETSNTAIRKQLHSVQLEVTSIRDECLSLAEINRMMIYDRPMHTVSTRNSHTQTSHNVQLEESKPKPVSNICELCGRSVQKQSAYRPLCFTCHMDKKQRKSRSPSTKKSRSFNFQF
ncbi:hypothetical protein PCE1_001832 [Barthelona sp. PCE]